MFTIRMNFIYLKCKKMKNVRKKNTLLKNNFDFRRFGVGRPLMLGALSVAFFSNSMPIWAEQSNNASGIRHHGKDQYG